MKKLITALSLAFITIFSSCKTTGKQVADSSVQETGNQPVEMAVPVRGSKPLGQGQVNALPKATVFKMNGDYADKVAITLNSNGDVTYFPAPSDISQSVMPVKLDDGWYLNRQGLGINSVFLKYSFKEYSELPKVPTIAELKEAIIPGSRVTEIVQLPYNINQANDKIPEIKEFLKKLSAK